MKITEEEILSVKKSVKEFNEKHPTWKDYTVAEVLKEGLKVVKAELENETRSKQK